MAIASDVDDSSTGRSGKPVENEDTNMLADSSGSKQIDCTVHHYYEKLKDFAFDMPGGWTDATISLFIDTFKLYKDDFSRPHSDDLKIWQKIAKRCVERSNNLKVFTVNSVMELAGSLKSHVLRNEYRKDDEYFKMLCNDVVDIMPYFPNTTCDSVSQNLRLRRRNPPQEVTTFAKVTEPPAKAANIDNLILKYCKELNIKNGVNCCNSNWNTMSVRILKEHGMKVDVKKHLGDMKRKIHKELKTVTDPAKKKTLFYKAIGPFWQYFNVMPPRTIKIDDFDKDFNEAEFASREANAENSSDEQNSRTEVEQTTPPISDGPRVYGGATPKKSKPGSSNLETFPRISNFLGITDHCYNPECDEPEIKNSSACKENDSVDSPATSEASNENGDAEVVEKLGEVAKLPPSKKKAVVEFQTEPSKTLKGKNAKSTDDETFLPRSSRVLKRPASSTSRNSKNTGEHNNAKNARISEKAASLTKNVQNQIELLPLKTGSSPVPAHCHNTTKRVVHKRQVGVTSRSKKVNTEPVVQTNMEMNSINFDGEAQPEARSAAPVTANCVDRLKSKNIVTPINVKVNDLLQQEASTSASCTEQRYITRPEITVQQRPPNPTMSQEFNRLERLEDSTVRIIEGYMEKVKESGHSVMQLIPKQHIAIPPVGVLPNSAPGEMDLGVQPLPVSKPPAWFDSFFTDYKKHEMWKMHQILKMQQELVDMENRKLNVLDKILNSLNDKKS